MDGGRTQSALLLLAITAISFNFPAHGKPVTTKQDSCKSFVQNFYNWYANLASKTDGIDPLATALNQRRGVFGDSLYNQLQEDRKAAEKVPGEIVGLDFDPILNTNAEPAKKYTVQDPQQKGKSYVVNVFGQFPDSRGRQLISTPEVVPHGSTWQFVNFHYQPTSIPENKDLLSILAALRKGRNSK